MTLAKYSLLLLVVTGSLYAQQMSHPVMVSRDDAFSSPRQSNAFPDTIDVLAVMVQFQQDNDTRTSGDGRFVLTGPSDIIDPAPHDRLYAVNHMTFIANYFRKVSKGKVLVRATVVDSVFTLPSTMQTYSPPREGSTIAVGNLARDTWYMVDSSGRVPDFSVYDCFVLLHAGVGRDVDLVSILGYDPTPFDIPSLYLGLGAFRSYYGSNYEGIPVSGGTFHITNTIVVPETESRTLPTATGNVLLELGINGLLCASVGNFLGLPDLFDTNTGRSGIGRFGLMDGQAIFSFAGLFPPEPSAWEKYWLGWVDPIVVPPGENDTLRLPAVALSDSIYRVAISPQEYFLVENRNRDPLRNGQTVTSISNGIVHTEVFPRDTAGFNATDISALSGVITNVDDFDWSIPGGVDNSGTFYDGGVLIWHIDEAVIREGLATNGVNGNPRRRGVDLEEADGSQDIGQQYEFLEPGSGSEEGTPLDFWYAGNRSPVNRNIFSATTHPDSRSNSGALSHITLRGFSARGPRMTAVVSRGDGDISPVRGFPKLVDKQLSAPSLTIASLDPDGVPEITVTTTALDAVRPSRTGTGSGSSDGGKIWSWKADGSPALASGNSLGMFARASIGAGFSGAAAESDLNNDTIPEIVAGETHAVPPPTLITAYSARSILPESLAAVYFSRQTGRQLMTSPVIADSIVAIGGTGGRVFLLRRDGSVIDTVVALVDTTAAVAGISLLDGNTFVITGSDGTVYKTSRDPNGGVGSDDQRKSFVRQIAGPAVAGSLSRTSTLERIFFATTDGTLHTLDGQLNELPGFPIATGRTVANPPALADLNKDGSRDIVVFGGNQIFAYNANGAMLDNYPITLTSSQPLTSAPVIADVDGDGDFDVIGATGDGLVVAYDGEGRTASGFPLQAGSGYQSVGVFNARAPLNSFETILVVASSLDGSISAWRTAIGSLPGPPVHPWPQYQKDAQHSGLATEPLTGVPLSSEFFPESRAYNWPNPVYDGKTFIRYFVNADAAVTIKIFDLAGDLVTEFPGPGVGGLDNEVEWNVGDVQSGIYFARIEASGGAGSGVAVVKVAVVK